MRTRNAVPLLASVLLAGFIAVAAGQQQRAAMKIESSGFTASQPIPQKFSCEGADISPPLAWSGAPPGTTTFALIADDPDAPAGTWVHWVLFNLPASTTSLPEGVAKTDSAAGGVQGKNDFGNIGYGGPCPPPGKPHRYFFKLYALDTSLSLSAGARKQDVEKAMQGHVIAQAELMGTYQRKK